MAKVQKEAGPIIKLADKVDVISTDKDPHHETGSWFKLHPEVAKQIVKKGLAKYPTEKEKADREKALKDQAAQVDAARKKQQQENE
jgi:hypothetical protein